MKTSACSRVKRGKMLSARESINEEQRVGIELVNAFLFVFHALIERKMEEYVS